MMDGDVKNINENAKEFSGEFAACKIVLFVKENRQVVGWVLVSEYVTIKYKRSSFVFGHFQFVK